jgi:aerotaxis receptor
MAQGIETLLSENDFIISETDARGVIIMVNYDFIRISEYSFEELVGSPHNIVRHPDMPKAAFKDLWTTIKSGKIWTGYVKNRTKSGGFYWVFSTVSPIVLDSGEVHYLSCRKKVTREEIAEAEALYKTMN